MKKVVLTESNLKKLVYESAKRVISMLNEARRPYPADEWGNYKSPAWNDEDFGFKEYDTEGEAEGIREKIEKVRQLLSNPFIKQKAVRMSKLGYSRKSLERFFSEDLRGGFGDALYYYLEPKSRETGEPTYVCALNFGEMSPEEQIADITKYVTASMKDEFGKTYDRYKGDFEWQSKIRNRVDSDVDAFVQKHGDVNPESMTYVELSGLDKELKSIGYDRKQDYYNIGPRTTYRDDILKHLNNGQLKDLIARVNAEIEKRRDNVKNYNIGYINKFDPHYNTSQAEYDEWDELQALMKKYKHINTGEWSNYRGDNAYWGELVDENGELVATYRYRVDSSD